MDLKEQRTTSSPLPLCSFEGNHQDIHLGKCRDHLPIKQLENQTFFFFFFDSQNLGFFNQMLMPGKQNNFRTASGCVREVARWCQQQRRGASDRIQGPAVTALAPLHQRFLRSPGLRF